MRKRGGIQSLQQKKDLKLQYDKIGQKIQQEQLQTLQNQLDIFKSNLIDFSRKYKSDLATKPEFRAQFTRMCFNIASKGFWGEILGVSDFYYELAIQICEVCIATRERTGGLLDFQDLKTRLRGREITDDDVMRSLNCLKELGSGFGIVVIGGKKMVQSIPRELNLDFSKVIALAEDSGFVSIQNIVEKLNWSSARAEDVLEGICWVDYQASPHEYWVISFFKHWQIE